MKRKILFLILCMFVLSCCIVLAACSAAVDPYDHHCDEDSDTIVWTIEEEPTCDQDGSEYGACSVCVSTYIRRIDELGHDLIENTVEPTCDEGGYTEYSCSRCDLEGITYIAELGHVPMDNYAVVTEPACLRQGYTTYHCTRCDEDYHDDYVDALQHIAGESFYYSSEKVCTEGGYKYYRCTICSAAAKEVPIGPIGHSYESEWTYDTFPTYQSVGWRSKHCKLCGDRTSITQVPCLPYTDGLEYMLNAGYSQLTAEDVKQIASIMIENLTKRLGTNGIKIKVAEETKELIAKKGFDASYGARPLRRAIQTMIEDKIAEELLEGTVKKGKTIKVIVDAEEIVVK